MTKGHLVAASLVAAFILAMAVMPLASAQTEVVIPSSMVEQGQSTTVPITIENTADAVSGVTVNLWFNPAVVNVTGVTQGDFPGSFTPNTANTADGWIRVVTEVGANPSLTDASIVVATVTLEAVGDIGTSCSLGLEVVSLLNDGFQSIPYTPMNGTFTIPAATRVVIPSCTIESGTSTVPITIENTADAVSGVTVNLWFNPAVVNVTGVTQGDFPGSFTPNTANTADGWIRVVTEVGANPSLTDASIVVATVTLEAVGDVGTSCPLGLEVVSLLNDGFQSILCTPMNGTFTVGTGEPQTLGSVVISPDSADLEIDVTQLFTAICYDTSDNSMSSGYELTWACGSPAIGTIDSSGLFTACGVGTATVTVTATGRYVKTDTAIVTVSAPTETISVDGDNFTEVSIDAGTANIAVNGTFNNSVTGSIGIKPIADPEATVGSDEFTGNDVALLGLTVTPDAAIAAELANGNDTIRIEVCYDAAELASKDISQSTLAIWRFDGTGWVKMVAGTDPCVANGRDGNCVWIEVNNLSVFALAGTTTSSMPSGGGGGGSGTYPPGWLETPTPTVTPASSSSSTTPDTTATAAKTAAQVATKKPTVKPAAQTADSDTTPSAPEKKGLLPGFEGVFAIAGLLAIGYVMMRRKR